MDWQPIETAPKDGTTVLLYGLIYQEHKSMAVGKWIDESYDELVEVERKGNRVISEWVKQDRGHWDAAGMYDPTHWMPPPAPPDMESGE